jgi:hypothetical protein
LILESMLSALAGEPIGADQAGPPMTGDRMMGDRR